MTQYIGFFTNRSTKDEFIAPVEAEDRAEARMAFDQAYPSTFYTLLTIYARSELNNALTSVDRWPGLPSKMQKPVAAETKTSHITAQMGGLPPLTRNQPKAALPAADGATIKTVTEAASKAQTSEMQAMALRLATALSAAKAPAAELKAPASAHGRAAEDVTASIPQTSAIAALKALHGGKGATMAAQAYAPAAAPAAPAAPHKGTLIDVLKAMRNH